MHLEGTVIFIIYTLLGHGQAEVFDPKVEIRYCSATDVIIQVAGAVTGGIVYIQGRNEACMRTSTAETQDYEFSFETCNITLDDVFRVVIQQSATYQTGGDKVIPIMCVFDHNDIIVGNVYYPELTNEGPGINATLRPTASMRIMRNDTDDVSGGGVIYLDDMLSIVIELGSAYKHDFDIKAQKCVASGLQLVENDCSHDRALFPDFTLTTPGRLVSKFKAFVPTNLPEENDNINIEYTCALDLCRGTCEQTLCATIMGRGRRKRTSTSPEKQLSVGTSVKLIKHRPSEALISADDVCLNKIMTFSVVISGGLMLIISWLFSCYLYQRLPTSRGLPNANIAKAIGRRMSTMLNIPTEYKVSGHRGLQGGWEEETPTRVSSVLTVSIYTQTDTCFCLCCSQGRIDFPNLCQWNGKPLSPHNGLDNASTTNTRSAHARGEALTSDDQSRISCNDCSEDTIVDSESGTEKSEDLERSDSTIASEIDPGNVTIVQGHVDYLDPSKSVSRPPSMQGRWKSKTGSQIISIGSTDDDDDTMKRHQSETSISICLPFENPNKETKA